MKQNFMNTVKVETPSTNFFDLTHDHKFSCNMGYLIPTMVLECIPGDKHRIGTEALTRFAPLLAPVMHRIQQYFHTFFVPSRVLWPNWEKYISPQEIGAIPPAHPYVVIGTPLAGRISVDSSSLADYLGLPLTSELNPDQTETAVVSAFPFAAVQKIYSDYFRDQNLVDEVTWELVDGNNTTNVDLPVVRRRAWEHDLFTASLPFAQKGSPVDIPFSFASDAPVYRDRTGDGPSVVDLISGLPDPLNIAHVSAIDPDGHITADSLYAKTSQLDSTATANINDLRMAIRLQEFLEQDARGGTRYVESIYVHFGVTSDDARLQRAEYITGSSQTLNISEVLNTTGTEDAPQGDMAGHGIAYTEPQHSSYYCKEHGWIITLMSILPKTAYQQGIAKHWLRINDRYEYYWPKMAHLGEEAVQNQEIYAYTDNVDPLLAPEGTFGYMPRYYDYRYQPNRVSGDFQTSLAFWHEGRIFDLQPQLNQEFIECTPSDRIFAVQDAEVQKVWCQVVNHVKSERKIPFFGTPTL